MILKMFKRKFFNSMENFIRTFEVKPKRTLLFSSKKAITFKQKAVHVNIFFIYVDVECPAINLTRYADEFLCMLASFGYSTNFRYDM